MNTRPFSYLASTHGHPDQCLPFLDFNCCDGGREDYFNSSSFEDRPDNIQDCAVVAVSLAALFNPRYKSPALSYMDALSDLRHFNRLIKPWTKRNFRESSSEFIKRRLNEIYVQWRSNGIPRHQNPVYGTNTDTLSNCLRSCGFSVVFDHPVVTEPVCLCQSKGKFVVDGMFGDGADHAFAMIDGTIVADYDFWDFHNDFHVMHIWRRN